MNKNFIKIFIILVLSSSLVGCGKTTSEKSYKDAFVRSFNDGAVELEDDYDIEYALFRNNWRVRVEQKPRLAELLKRMIHKKGTLPNLQVNEGYFTFTYDRSGYGYYKLDIVVDCLVNNEPRWLYIDCGRAYVESQYLNLDKKWYVSLQDKEQNDIQESWAWCYYDKGEIEDDFWRPRFTYASDNYMYMTSGIYLKSY